MPENRFERRAKSIAYVLLALAVLAAVIVVKRDDTAGEYLPCRPPQAGEKLIVTGSADGKPFCVYHPIIGWGMAR